MHYFQSSLFNDVANTKPNIWDNYAPKVTSNTESLGGDSEEEEQMHAEDASPETILAGLDSLHALFTADKFHTKLLKEVSCSLL